MLQDSERDTLSWEQKWLHVLTSSQHWNGNVSLQIQVVPGPDQAPGRLTLISSFQCPLPRSSSSDLWHAMDSSLESQNVLGVTKSSK